VGGAGGPPVACRRGDDQEPLGEAASRGVVTLLSVCQAMSVAITMLSAPAGPQWRPTGATLGDGYLACWSPLDGAERLDPLHRVRPQTRNALISDYRRQPPVRAAESLCRVRTAA
jgi:hypothetical protein